MTESEEINAASLALDHAAEAIATLAAIMRDDSLTPAARISAANALLKWSGAKGDGKGSGVQIVHLYWGSDGSEKEGLTE